MEGSPRSLHEKFAYVFNRTALGLGVIAIGWLIWNGLYLRALGGLFLIPVYFWLHKRVDAP